MARFKSFVLVIALLPLLGVGCAEVAKKSPSMKRVDAQFTVNAETMRVRTRALVGPVGGFIEETGDWILSRTDDPVVRLEVLRIKADLLPAVRTSLFRPDPLTALLDTWALSEQLIDYFESGRGRELLGDWADHVVEAADSMRQEIFEVLSYMVDAESLERGKAFVADWAKRHPIKDSIAGRESILREVANFKVKSGTSGAKLVGSMAVTLDDMLRQIEAYSVNIPKQARWEAQLAVMEMVGAENLQRTRELLPVMLESAEALAGSADGLPGMVTREREAVLEALRRERMETLVFLRQERLETIDQIASERQAVLDHTERMRQDVTASVHDEVHAISELLRQERAKTMVEAGQLAGLALDGSFERATDLIDQLFLRLLIVLGLIFVGCVALILLAWVLFRRMPVNA